MAKNQCGLPFTSCIMFISPCGWCFYNYLDFYKQLDSVQFPKVKMEESTGVRLWGQNLHQGTMTAWATESQPCSEQETWAEPKKDRRLMQICRPHRRLTEF